MKTRKLMTLTGALAVSALALTACGETEAGQQQSEAPAAEEGGTDWTNCTPGQDSAEADVAADENKNITIGAYNGWDESFAVAYLTENVLEDEGYTVNVEAFEAGPGYTALAQGDIDFAMDTWLPITHADYLNQYGDDIEAAGCWYDNAKLTLAVNEDSPAQSIADLPDMVDDYGGTIYGIEAGAGLTQQTEESAIPTYGLDDYDFKISSTPAMLAELKSATDADENVLVTLWRPHWAYDAFPVRDLEDPEGAMGDAELIYSFARSGFSEENPEVFQLVKNFVFDDEHLASLENIMFSDEHYGGEDPEEAVAEWVEDNQDFVDDWKAGALA
ncbi:MULTISPECIES: glycine betaine ABC transporter substrate-binding protein [Brevibacterium]|jgi:glycine betaine/proline transport system substrate-binding protein|uniref:Glycine betaine ABC transporter substrate-binding protein n=1 Tax=Brevibacterium salitolerans TaxID=1403566 RepID=A0ABN2WNS1_9MICO|nr:glycine betaine ABC transporter substrate-binding protein [Brevibacterium sp.]